MDAARLVWFSGASRPASRSCSGAVALEVGRHEIEVAQLDALEAAEPDAAQLRLERRGVSDKDHRQPIRFEIRARHPLDVLD